MHDVALFGTIVLTAAGIVGGALLLSERFWLAGIGCWVAAGLVARAPFEFGWLV